MRPAPKATPPRGRFKADDLNLAVLARHHAEAMRIVDRVGWR